MNTTLKRIFNLTAISIKGKGGRIAILYCVIVLLLNLSEIFLALKMIHWNKDFYSALEKYDGLGALYQIGVFAVITGINSFQFLVASYIRQLIQMRWRTTLTDCMLKRWFDHKAYWHMQMDTQSTMDNPDQRISEDCRIFVERLTGRGLDLFTSLVGLSTYAFLLWKLSDFPLSIPWGDREIVIHHYLIIAAPIYVLISSGLTHWMGAPLMRLNVISQHREADMRFALARLRESKEAVALENGEGAERHIIDQRYKQILSNWKQRMNREFILGIFTRPYYMTVLRIPLFLAFPAYLMGHVTLGGLMQLGSAFTRLVTTLSWFIFSYRELAELSATARRLGDFIEETDAIVASEVEKRVKIVKSPDQALHIRDLWVDTPSGESLIHINCLDINPGETVWINGPSGIGKSTLIKALSGIWRYCEGNIQIPPGKIYFSPQKVYLPLGSLAECVCYPESLGDIARIQQILSRVGLNEDRHIQQLEQKTALDDDYRLSGGEQQRLQIARILYAAPDWVILDEATSSLDRQAENDLYRIIREQLPHSGIIVIAHREPKGLGEVREFNLWPANRKNGIKKGSEADELRNRLESTFKVA